MVLPKRPINSDFPAGLRCPRCDSRDTVAYPDSDVPDDDSDYGCNDCLLLWDEDSEHGTTVIVNAGGQQPDFERDNVVGLHVDYDAVADEELAQVKNGIEEGDEVDIVYIIYANGTDGRIVTENARVKTVGPML